MTSEVDLRHAQLARAILICEKRGIESDARLVVQAAEALADAERRATVDARFIAIMRGAR